MTFLLSIIRKVDHPTIKVAEIMINDLEHYLISIGASYGKGWRS